MLSPAAAAMLADDPASPDLGIELTRAAHGRAEARLTVTPTMVNGLGVCHGGLIFALADTALAFAANSERGGAMTTSASIEFLRPARSGDELVATAEPVAAAGRTELYGVTVTVHTDDRGAAPDSDEGAIAALRGSVRRS